MKNVNINKTVLLQILRDNKEKHLADYAEAVEDYMSLALKIAKDNLKIAKICDLDQLKRNKPLPSPPECFENDYNRSIRMLELIVLEDVTIEIEEHLFNQLVLDEWQWKQTFTNLSLSYKAGL